ncbi:MAG: right-handed parallel beta-helix repeat-containing protein [Gammaproteobacteria bacterium]
MTDSTRAEVFDVFPTGMTDSCSEPFEAMANALQPGDELVLHDGIYAQGCARRLTINGTASQPIVIRAAAGASPLLTRPAASGCCHNNIELSGSYFTLRGLRFQHGSAGVRFQDSHHITFEDNEIFDTLNNALTMNSADTNGHVIRNNHIHDTGLDPVGETEGEGMYIGCHSGNCVASNHLIENNYIHHLRGTSSGGNDGIEIKFRSYGNTVRGNVIHDTNIGTSYPCIFAYGHGAGAPNVIESNLVYNCGEAILVSADAIVRNNLVVSSSSHGIHSRQQNPAPGVKNLSIVNNTIYGTHPTCVQLRWNNATNVTFANNAVYCAGSTAMNVSGAGNALLQNNVVRGGMSGVGVDGMAFVAGPAASSLFVDASSQDFRLLDGATLIDAGDTAVPNLPALDYAGNARIAGGSVDVGAYEYAGAGADTDGDGVADATDNCTSVANPGQRDTDNDGYGNRCDPDLNNDGVVNIIDLGLMREVFFTDNADADLNGDGVVNVTDLGLLRVLFFMAPGPGA